MRGSFEEGYDEDLPWDPFWEYVLGEDELDAPEPTIRLPGRKKKINSDDSSSILDYLVPESDSRDDPSTTRSFLSSRTGERDDNSSRRSIFGKKKEVNEPSVTSFDSLSQILGPSVENKEKPARRKSTSNSIKSDESSRNGSRGWLWDSTKGDKDEPVESPSNTSFTESFSQILGADDSSSKDEQVEKKETDTGIEVIRRQVVKEDKPPSRSKRFWRRSKKDQPGPERNFLEQSLSGFMVSSFGSEEQEEIGKSGRRKREGRLNEDQKKSSKRRKKFWGRKKKDAALPVEPKKSGSESNFFEESLSVFLGPSFDGKDDEKSQESRESSESLNSSRSFDEEKKTPRRHKFFWRRSKKGCNEPKESKETPMDTPTNNSFEETILNFLDPSSEHDDEEEEEDVPVTRRSRKSVDYLDKSRKKLPEQRTESAGNSFEDSILNFFDPPHDEEYNDDYYDDDEEEETVPRRAKLTLDRSAEYRRKSTKQQRSGQSNNSFEETIMNVFDPSPNDDANDSDDHAEEAEEPVPRKAKKPFRRPKETQRKSPKQHKTELSKQSRKGRRLLNFFDSSPGDDGDDDDDDDDDDNDEEEDEPVPRKERKSAQRPEDSKRRPSKQCKTEASHKSFEESLLSFFNPSSDDDPEGDDEEGEKPVPRRAKYAAGRSAEYRRKSTKQQRSGHSNNSFEETIMNVFDPSPNDDVDDSDDHAEEAEEPVPRKAKKPFRRPKETQRKSPKQHKSELSKQSRKGSRLLNFFDSSPGDDGDDDDDNDEEEDEPVPRKERKSAQRPEDSKRRPSKQCKTEASHKSFEESLLSFFNPSPDDDPEGDDEEGEKPVPRRAKYAAGRSAEYRRKSTKQQRSGQSNNSFEETIMNVFDPSPNDDANDSDDHAEEAEEPVPKKATKPFRRPKETQRKSPKQHKSELSKQSRKGSRLLNFFDSSPGDDGDDDDDDDDDDNDEEEENEPVPRKERKSAQRPEDSKRRPSKQCKTEASHKSFEESLLSFFDPSSGGDDEEGEKPVPRRAKFAAGRSAEYRRKSTKQQRSGHSNNSFEETIMNALDPSPNDDVDDSDDHAEEAEEHVPRKAKKPFRRPKETQRKSPKQHKSELSKQSRKGSRLLNFFDSSPGDGGNDDYDDDDDEEEEEPVPRKERKSLQHPKDYERRPSRQCKTEASHKSFEESLLSFFDPLSDNDPGDDEEEEEEKEEPVPKRVRKPVQHPKESQAKSLKQRKSELSNQSPKQSLLNSFDPSLDDGDDDDYDDYEKEEPGPRSARESDNSLDESRESSSRQKQFWRRSEKKESRAVSVSSMASISYVLGRSVNSRRKSKSGAPKNEEEPTKNRRSHFWRRKKRKKQFTMPAKDISSKESLSEESSSDDQGDSGFQTTTTVPRKEVTFSPLEQVQRNDEWFLQTQGSSNSSNDTAAPTVSQEERSRNKEVVATGAAAFSLGNLLASWSDSSEESTDEFSLEEESSTDGSQFTEEASTFTRDTSLSTVQSVSTSNDAETTKQRFTEIRLAFTPRSITKQSLLAIEEEANGANNHNDENSSEVEELSAASDTTEGTAGSIGSVDQAEKPSDSTQQKDSRAPDEIDFSNRSESLMPRSMGMTRPGALMCRSLKDSSKEDRHEKETYTLYNVSPQADVKTKSSMGDSKTPTVSRTETNTSLETSSAIRSRTLLCRGTKSFSDEQLGSASGSLHRESSIHFHELSPEEIAEIFPKVCTVVDDRAEMIGNSNSFDDSFLPARLQTSLPRRGKPQSIFEYEYETGRHMFVSYKQFGSDPRALVKLGAATIPGQNDYDSGTVLVQVEASTVSQTDCFIRHGLWWGKEAPPLPNVPGVDIAGKIFRIDKTSSERFRLRVGDRVVSLTRWGGNSRFLSIDASKLIKILHHGTIGSRRYRKNSLKGKTYLILGSLDPNMARAIAQLASHSDVETVYAASKHKHFDNLKSLGIIPLQRDNYDWYESLKYQVDCIISFEEEVSLIHYKLLRKDGEIILVSSDELKIDVPEAPGTSPGLVCRRYEQQQQSRTYVYDVYKEWDEKLECCKKDLEHLAHLLDNNNIAPHILDRIPLSKVPRAQELIESKRLSGFLVCEPWLVAKARAIRL